uniref:Uncharacterized protein n=1 Tax=Sciurus vulgaris TaxID=55149 RepID=A0A8D2ASJ5_SCIVU
MLHWCVFIQEHGSDAPSVLALPIPLPAAFPSSPLGPVYFLNVSPQSPSLLCLPLPADGVFGRCQKVPAVDTYRYAASPLALQHLRVTLQKLSRTGGQAGPLPCQQHERHFSCPAFDAHRHAG